LHSDDELPRIRSQQELRPRHFVGDKLSNGIVVAEDR